MSDYEYFPRTVNYLNVCSAMDKDQLKKLSNNKTEMVDHPKHYNIGELEAITVIEDQGLGEAFCTANIIKYIMRYKHKGTPLEDLKKIKWYTERLITYYENSNKK